MNLLIGLLMDALSVTFFDETAGEFYHQILSVRLDNAFVLRAYNKYAPFHCWAFVSFPTMHTTNVPRTYMLVLYLFRASGFRPICPIALDSHALFLAIV